MAYMSTNYFGANQTTVTLSKHPDTHSRPHDVAYRETDTWAVNFTITGANAFPI